MSTMKFSKDHEWVKVDGDIATVGISQFAQSQLGDIVFVELPQVGRELSKGEEAAVVESVKAASDVYSPVTGTVTEVNGELEAEPSLANTDPENAGWFFKVKLASPSDLDDLMDADAYNAFVEEQH
jgi:glycine cleavage system H protein